MSKESAGLLLHRTGAGGREVLLVHPGGPFWARKDLGAWTIPKGEIDPGEDPLAAARREFQEETGAAPPAAEGRRLPTIVQRGGKRVHAWAVEGDLAAERVVSNTVTIEWPPRSGLRRTIPEIDRAAWFPLAEARRRINPAQAAWLTALESDGR